MKTMVLAAAALAALALSVTTDAANARHYYRGYHGAYGHAYGRFYRARDPDWFIREQIRRDVPLKDRPPS
jgi:hypothetical protein